MAKHDAFGIRGLCLAGALNQAVRDIFNGFPDWTIHKYLLKRWKNCSPSQADEIIRIAHQAVIAGGALTHLPPGHNLPANLIPKLPRQ
jgi:hypothetical protein